ncbi:hypothetical protein GmHk_09G024894 [Glycine max]|nr:hypothetical protein GmHk_09G024894 [Glycine max]
MKTITKQFEELDVCGKVTLKSKLREIAYPDLNSTCAPLEKNSNSSVKHSASSSEQPIQRRSMSMLDQFHPCIHDSIVNIVDVKVDGNCGYPAIVVLLGMVKIHGHWCFDEYINLVGDIDIFKELKRSLLVDGLSMVTMIKWMNITNMGYVIASRYNMVLVSLLLQQSMTFFPLRSQPPTDSYVHRVICIDHVFLRERYLLPPLAFLRSTHCHHQAKQ